MKQQLNPGAPGQAGDRHGGFQDTAIKPVTSFPHVFGGNPSCNITEKFNCTQSRGDWPAMNKNVLFRMGLIVLLNTGAVTGICAQENREGSARVEASGDSITLQNHWLRRIFITGDKTGVSTREYYIRNTESGPWLPLFTFAPGELPCEASVTINGIEGKITGADKPGLKIKSSFAFETREVIETDIGKRLDIAFRPLASAGMPAVRVTLHHELPDDQPFMIKWMTVENLSDRMVMWNGATVEVLHSAQHAWIEDDYCTNTASASPDMPGWTFYRFPLGPDVSIQPGEKKESFKLYELFPNPDPYAEAVARNRMRRTVAPWTDTQAIFQMWNGCTSVEEMYPIVDDAAELGVEAVGFFVGQWETQVGDFVLKKDVFPNGERDLARLVDHAHAKGLKFVLYTGMCIAWESSETAKTHPEWQFLSEGGFRYSAGAHGNMCLAGPWGDYYRANIFRLTEKCGIDGWQTDGPYYGTVCYQTGHDHTAPASAQYLNWQYEKNFYNECRRRGLIIQTPQSWRALLHGANQLPGGYTEEDQVALEGLNLVATFRSRLFDRMLLFPPTVRWTFISIDRYHGRRMYAEDAPAELRRAMFEHSIAGCFGYGHAGHILARKLYRSEEEKDVFRKWIGFYKKYRKLVEHTSLPLLRPDGRNADGVFHCNPEADGERGVVVAFNPSSSPQKVHFTVPVKYAGITETALAGPPDSVERMVNVDDRGNGIVTVDLEPYEVTWWEVRQAAR